MRRFRLILPIALLLIFAGGAYFYLSRKTPPLPYQSRLISNEIINEESTPTKTETLTPTKVTPNEVKKKMNDQKSTTEKEKILINHNVPFTSQAPTGGWADERQQDGCEEASAIMAMEWVRGESLSKQEILQEILTLSDYEQTTYGEYRDINLADIKNWIFADYFKYKNITHQKNIRIGDIINALYSGNIILLPMNGQKLYNPYFTAPGPERHMILVRGYDPTSDEFITNDPGTKRGENYRYKSEIIMNAILVYPTGYHVTTDESLKEMLVIGK